MIVNNEVNLRPLLWPERLTILKMYIEFNQDLCKVCQDNILHIMLIQNLIRVFWQLIFLLTRLKIDVELLKWLAVSQSRWMHLGLLREVMVEIKVTYAPDFWLPLDMAEMEMTCTITPLFQKWEGESAGLSA